MRIIDLFSGAGGLTFGFYYRIKQNKFVRNRKNSFVFANELDPFAAEAFKANFPDIRMINEDIKQLDKDTIEQMIGEEPVDLIIGGPPCQSFSNAANAISELVANGLDAKAKNVYVYIDMSDKEHSIIEIIDDGIGMNYNDLASKYVWIGRNKRNDEELLEDEKKNVMGRKGIGKLAALYLSNNYYILTKKKGDLIINQWEINLSKYQDSDFPKLDRISQKITLVNEKLWEKNQQGTAIVLNNVDLRRNGTKRIEALKRVFADYYLICL